MNRKSYFYLDRAQTPSPAQVSETLEHLTGRTAIEQEAAQIERQLDVSQSDYSPGGDVHRTRRVVIR